VVEVPLQGLIAVVATGIFVHFSRKVTKKDTEESRLELESLRKSAHISGKYFEAPHTYDPRPGELTLFLGGGISGCPDWQSSVFSELRPKCPHLVIYNPRREKFDVMEPSQSKIQILWEHKCLRQSKAIMFWFPSETLCPITLYELGAWTILSKTTGTKLFVACHPNYARIEDVRIQTQLVDESILVGTSLEQIVGQIEKWYNDNKK